MKSLASLILAAGCLLVATAAHADRWDRRKGDCDQVFERWRTASIDRLRKCVMTWEMYRNVREVDADQRAIVHEAFNKLYNEGNRRDAVMARSALKKLGLRTKKMRVEANAKDRTVDPRDEARIRKDNQPRVIRRPPPETARPQPTRAPSRGEAKRAYREAMKFYKSRDFAVALSEFLIAADADPTYAQPLYMAARCYVFLGKAGPAIQSLQKMKAIGNNAALELVAKSTTDPVFAKLSNVEAFKALTGSALVQILNAGGDKGKKIVKDYASKLEASGIAVASVANDRVARRNSYIFHKPGYQRQAEVVRRQLKLGLIHKRPIDWPSEYDVILIYGSKGKSDWVDDEAEKAGKGEAEKKKKAEEEAAKKQADAEKAAKEKMKKQMEMIKMMQEMNADSAAGSGVDAAKTAAPPP